MKDNYQNQKLAHQVSQLIKKHGTGPQLLIRVGTPAVADGPPGPAAGWAVLTQLAQGVDSGFHTCLQTEKQLIDSAHELNNIQDKKNFVMPNINNLLTQREKFLTQN